MVCRELSASKIQRFESLESTNEYAIRHLDGLGDRQIILAETQTAGHSHSSERGMPGGWNGYLERIDGILAWCRQSRIPVRTYSEWARILYHTKPDPAVNVFPDLDVDLDSDGIPDGYEVSPDKLDRKDGLPDNGGVSLGTGQTGPICRLERLCGLEKGCNDFTIWTHGCAGSTVEVTFDFPEAESKAVLAFPAAGSGWAQHHSPVTVPASASFADISIQCTSHIGRRLRVSGMRLCQAP